MHNLAYASPILRLPWRSPIMLRLYDFHDSLQYIYEIDIENPIKEKLLGRSVFNLLLEVETL